MEHAPPWGLLTGAAPAGAATRAAGMSRASVTGGTLMRRTALREHGGGKTECEEKDPSRGFIHSKEVGERAQSSQDF
jgi:hypothetical protein